MSIAEKLTQIAENQQVVYDAGFTAGQNSGGGGYDEGYEAGQQAEYDRFWDEYQDYGERLNYTYAFYYWREKNCAPKYDLKPTHAAGCFAMSLVADVKVEIDFAENECTQAASMFANCGYLRRISKIIAHKNLTFSSFLNACGSLEEVTFEGVIGKNGLNLQWSTKLTSESLLSIISCLEDKSADTSGTEWKVTIGPDNYAKLTEGDIAVAEQKGWVLE